MTSRKLVMGILAAMLFAPTWVLANDGDTKEEIDKRVTEEIRMLAADDMEGRGPGTQGLQRAAEYIRDEFKRAGLKPLEGGSYFQPFTITTDMDAPADKNFLVLKGPEDKEVKMELNTNYRPIGKNGKASGDLVFVGYGIAADDKEYNEYKDIDVEGKIVVLIRREPQQNSEDSRFDGKGVSTHSYIATKIKRAQDAKAAAVIMVNDPYTVGRNKRDVLEAMGRHSSTSGDTPFAHITVDAMNGLLEVTPVKTADGAELKTVKDIEAHINEYMTPMSQALPWKADFACDVKPMEVVNVIGILEGEGPHANETIVVGAHYDHLGMGGRGSRRPGVYAVHNGADDNATGTVAVMELARRFAAADKKPGRRIVFIAFSAEERGLLGARHYVNNPAVPLEDTAVMINFDMVGRVTDNVLEVHGLGSASVFEQMLEVANEGPKFNLKKVPTSGGGSDHLPFLQKKIPCFWLFSGRNKVYHTPDDDFETLNMDGVIRSIDLCESMMEQLLAVEERPEFNTNMSTRRPGRPAGIPDLGFRPNYSSEAKQVSVQALRENTPAAKAGLQVGDVILSVNDTDITTTGEFIRSIRGSAGKTLKVKIKRGDEEKIIEIKP